MEYLFITIFQLIGVAWRSLQDLNGIVKDKNNVALNILQAFRLFWKAQVFSLIGSVLVLLTQTAIHWAIEYFYPPFMDVTVQINEYEFPIMFFMVVVIALILGYKGQEIMFKVFAKASDKALNYVDEKIK